MSPPLFTGRFVSNRVGRVSVVVSYFSVYSNGGGGSWTSLLDSRALKQAIVTLLRSVTTGGAEEIPTGLRGKWFSISFRLRNVF